MLCRTLVISNMALRILVIPVVARCLAAVRGSASQRFLQAMMIIIKQFYNTNG